MKKVLFSALAVMAVGAATYTAKVSEQSANSLFLDEVEALANPNEDNNKDNPDDIRGEIFIEPDCLYDIKNGKNIIGKEGVCVEIRGLETDPCTPYDCRI